MAFNYDEYLGFVTPRESGGDPNAQNPTSSASGLYQFTDPTYLAYAQKLNPGVSESALLAQKNDPTMQKAIMKAFTDDNVNALTNAGIDVNNGSVYAAHFLGPNGAVKALSAADNTPIDQVVSAAAIKANPGVFKNIKTVADLKAWTANPAFSGGVGTHTSDDPTNPADLPAPGATETSLKGGLPFGQQPQPEPSFWQKLMSGGPGAIFGKPQAGWNIGDALMGAGIAAMARDNPQAASALATMLNHDKKTAGLVPGTFNEKTGQALVQDGNGGITRAKIMDPFNPLSGKDLEDFNTHASNASEFNQIDQKAQQFADAILQGKIQTGVVNGVTRWVRGKMGDTNENDRLANDYERFLQDAVNGKLRTNKGTQTDRDFENEFKATAQGALDNPGDALKVLQNLSDKSHQFVQREQQSLQPYFGNGYTNVDPNQYKQQFDSMNKAREDWLKGFQQRRDEYLKQQDAKGHGGGGGPKLNSDGSITSPKGYTIRKVN